MLLIGYIRSCCDCIFHKPKLRLSKTYLENLKDIQERKFSTININKSSTFELELPSMPPIDTQDSKEVPLLENQEDTIELSDKQLSPTRRESVLKLEKFYENNIKTLFETVRERILLPFDGFEKIYEDTKSSHKLVMYMMSELDKDKNRIFTYRTEWIAPCDPEFFMGFLNDYQEQMKLSDNKMEEYYPIKTFGKKKNFSIVYLKYKKVLTISPRDFCYLKCAQLLDEINNIWIDCSQSISNELLPEYEDIVRGNILLHGYYIEPITIDGKYYSRVRFYSQIDFKVSIPIFMSKTFSIMEMKKYIQKSYERIEQAYKEKEMMKN